MFVFIYICTYTYIYIYMYVFLYVRWYKYVHEYVCMYMHDINLSVKTMPFPEHNQSFHFMIGTTGVLCEMLT